MSNSKTKTRTEYTNVFVMAKTKRYKYTDWDGKATRYRREKQDVQILIRRHKAEVEEPCRMVS